MTEKQLIASLQQMKEIKPRKEWASLLKSQILSEQKAVEIPAQKISIFDIISNWTLRGASATKFQISNSFSRRLAFSLATLLFVVVGIVGFANYTMPGNTTVALQEPASLKQAVTANLKSKITELANTLKNNPKEDPQAIKILAVSLKTLADASATDVKESQDIKDLYQTVVENQIADLEKSTLTEEQTKTLTEIKELYDQGKYTDALEEILLINN